MSPLTEDTLAAAVDELAGRDPDLAGAIARFGRPPLWARPAGFATLLQVILEQQVSLSSARAAYGRLVAAIGEPAPTAFLALDDAQLLSIGFSRQKARYGRELSTAVRAGRLDLEHLATLDDDAARAELVALPGVGPWTASIYLLMALGRPDIWPAGDIALAQATAEVKGLDARPDPGTLIGMAERWRPWRAVAARILWHHYLGVRGRA